MKLLGLFLLSLNALSANAAGKGEEPAKMHLLFSDHACQKILESRNEVSARPRDIDHIVKTFYFGPTNETTPDQYAFPESTIADSYLGHRFRKGVVILRYSKDALQYFNTTPCKQFVNKDPLLKMILSIPGVKKVKFEIDGKLFENSDA